MRALHIASCAFLLVAASACGEVVGSGSGTPDPTVESLSPDSGSLVGGTTVTVTGTGFDAGDAVVLVGGTLASGVTVVDDTSLTFVTPPGDVGGSRVDVTVSNQSGFATVAAAFRYHEHPVVIDVSPTFARAAGGTELTIIGRGFQESAAGAPTVTIGGVAATGVQVVDDQTIMATVAANSSADLFAPVDVVVSNANGTVTMEGAVKLTAPGLLGVERRCCANRNRLWYIRPSDGYSAVVGEAFSPVHACATSPTGEVFVATRASNGQRLARLDALTGLVEPIADIIDTGGTPRYANTMTFVGAGLFGFDGRSDNRLMSINPATGVATMLGASLGQSRQSSIGQRDAASVFFVDNDCQTLDSINTTTGVLTAGPALGATSCSSHRGMVTVGGMTYLAEYNGARRVYAMNTATGARTEIGRAPFSIVGLCATPAEF